MKVRKSETYVRWKDSEACKARTEKFYRDLKNEAETEKAMKAFRRTEKEQVTAPSIFDDTKSDEK